jgi:DNA modification methylase
MQDNEVDYVFTSPPYNRKRNDKYTFYNDQLTDYYGFLFDLIKESKRVAKKYVFLNIQTNYYNASDIYALIGAYKNEIRQVIVWQKSNPMPASGCNITNSYELFIVFGDEPLKSNHTYTKNIITTPVNSKMPKEHKAVMHPDVADWFIRMFTQEGETILDPCMGTGTTALACLQNKRNFVGFEISREYCALANERIKHITR